MNHDCLLPGTYQARFMSSSDKHKSWQCWCGKYWHTEFNKQTRGMAWKEGQGR